MRRADFVPCTSIKLVAAASIAVAALVLAGAALARSE